MKIGMLRRGDSVVERVWAKLGEIAPLAQWALLGLRGRPSEITLGDLRGAS